MEFKKKIFKTFKTLKGYDGLYVIKNSKEYLQICKKKKTEKVISFWCEASLMADVEGRVLN